MTKTNFNIKEGIKIPYALYDKSLKGTVVHGAKSRGANPLLYGLKRFRNYTLLVLSMLSPFNSLRVQLNRWKGVNIGKNVYLGLFVFLDNLYPEFIYIEDKAAVNAGSMIITHLNPYIHFEKIMNASASPVVIKEGAFVAVRSVLLPGVTIGEFSIVTAGSIVSKNVEPYTIVRGNPAVKVADFSRRMKNENKTDLIE
jgi:acetyltransferase-like isoleucine patch superfamily enzyme